MRRTGLAVLATTALLMLGGARPQACSCVGPTAACSSVWNYSDVFVARVNRVADSTPGVAGRSAPGVSATMQVLERFKGEAQGEVTVHTSRGLGTCGYAFEVARTYLVYAGRRSDNGALTTSICSRTAPVDRAAEDLAYLRGPYRQPSALGVIQGTVTRTDPLPEGMGETRSPYRGARILVDGPTGRLETHSAVDGTFELRVPAGRYRLTSEVPVGLYALPDGPRDVTLADARGCALVPIGVRPDGRIAGRLFDEDGQPLPFVTVEAADIDQARAPHNLRARESALTDLNGQFEIARLPPGDYLLGLTLNRDPRASRDDAIWLPSGRLADASPVVVGSEQRVVVGDLTLPEHVETVILSGLVVNEEDRPIPGAGLYVYGPSGSGFVTRPVETDRSGRFVVAVIVGREYRMVAEAQLAPSEGAGFRSGEVPQFTAVAGLPAFRIVVRVR